MGASKSILHRESSGRRDHANRDTVLVDIFKSFDGNGDGYITAVELNLCLTRFGIWMDPQEMNAVFKFADKNGDGKLSLNEYLPVMHQCCIVAEVKASFWLHDKDADGFLNFAEFTQFVHDVADGNVTDSKEIAHLFQVADCNGDGKIRLEDFARLADSNLPIATLMLGNGWNLIKKEYLKAIAIH